MPGNVRDEERAIESLGKSVRHVEVVRAVLTDELSALRAHYGNRVVGDGTERLVEFLILAKRAKTVIPR